jgi:hypothetical protein
VAHQWGGAGTADPPSPSADAPFGPVSDMLSGQPRSTNRSHLRRQCEKAWDPGGRNEQWSKLGICSGCRGSQSARPRNRIRSGCHGGDAGRLDGAGRHDRHLARCRWCYGMGSVAQVRGPAPYISIKVVRSLTDWGLLTAARQRNAPAGRAGSRPLMPCSYPRSADINSLVNWITPTTSPILISPTGRELCSRSRRRGS